MKRKTKKYKKKTEKKFHNKIHAFFVVEGAIWLSTRSLFVKEINSEAETKHGWHKYLLPKHQEFAQCTPPYELQTHQY